MRIGLSCFEIMLSGVIRLLVRCGDGHFSGGDVAID